MKALTIEPRRKRSEQNSVYYDACVSHIYEPLPARFRIKVSLIDVVGEDTADGDILGRTG